MAVLSSELWALSVCCLLFSSGIGSPRGEAGGTAGGGMAPSLCNSCPTSSLDTDTDTAGHSRQALLEVTKSHILRRLQLKHRPNVTSSIPRTALETVLRKLHAGKVSQNGSFEIVRPQRRPREDQTLQIISFPESETSSAEKAKLRFRLLQSADQKSVMLIHRASLWLHLHRLPPARSDGGRGRRRAVKVLVRSHGLSGHLSVKGINVYRSGWHSFPVTRAVQSSLDRGDKALSLDVGCQGCGNASASPVLLDLRDESHQPFLVARTRVRESGHRIRKRGIECNVNSSLCCRKEFYVDFRVIGWDDWIIAPTGYYGNYCVGACPSHMAGAPGTASSFHTAIFNLYKVNGVRSVSDLHSCCIPTRLNALSMLYFDGKQNIVKRDIPDMVVEECGCT